MLLQGAEWKVHVLSLSAVYGKPILPSSSASPSPVPFLQGGGGVKTCEQEVTDGGKGGESSDGPILPPPNVDNIPRPLSPTKLTPVGWYQCTSFMEQLITTYVWGIFCLPLLYSPLSDALSERCGPGRPPPTSKQRAATPEETQLHHRARGPTGAKHPKTALPEVGDTLCDV